MKPSQLLVPLALCLLALAGCKESSKPAAQVSPKEEAGAPKAAPKEESKAKGAQDPALLDPSMAKATAPATYKVKFDTTKGSFTVEVHRDWAPQGADRFYNLVKIGFFDDVAFFRAIEGFMVQFGISGDPKVAAVWRDATIPDDPPTQANTKGKITFATSGPNARTTQVFINYGDNSRLDGMGFAPFGEVVDGMSVVDSLYKGYGEGAPRGHGPNQGLIQTKGNEYLRKDFPLLDYVKTARIAE
ncbi:peptidylprolyl isomerase [Vulgatibacter incomptus]|uniref:Peptidyl-prolyl cis-trans isomerase n=1 Tax=Vulgatibacter incomptus TaxID=1391653 RepID=A0A0K1PGY9_9BACT|nr:peptidylprolyl isomerase [Vulgatibacter incomptus]AKU92798.1 Peptidyl-prolyl cis-trans isomerase PpiA precursor [Vulgatibacter incomptus]